MSWRVWLFAVVLAPCGAGMRAQAAVEVMWPREGSVVFGEPFEVEVRRTWPFGAEAEPFVEAALAPLSARLVSASRTEGTHGVEERLRLVARAWTVGTVVVPPLVLRARAADGTLIEAASTPPPLSVRSSLPEPAGGVEWLDLRELPKTSGGVWWFAAAGFTLLLVGFWFATTRRRPPTIPPVATAVAVAPHEETLAALAVLAAEAALAVGPEAEPFHTRLAEVVRGHIARRFQFAVDASTSEELVRAVPAGGAPLRDCLAACDLVKFAALAPPPGGAAAAVTCGVAFVRASMPQDGTA